MSLSKIVGSAVSDEVSKLVEMFSSNSLSFKKRIDDLEKIVSETSKEEKKSGTEALQDDLKERDLKIKGQLAKLQTSIP